MSSSLPYIAVSHLQQYLLRVGLIWVHIHLCISKSELDLFNFVQIHLRKISTAKVDTLF